MKEIEQYHKSCNRLVQKFAKKQELVFDYWVGEEIGGTASFCEEYFFSLAEIILDLETEQPRGKIVQWLQASVEDYFSKGLDSLMINYRSYIMGARYAPDKV
jgi:hypothetical protein